MNPPSFAASHAEPAEHKIDDFFAYYISLKYHDQCRVQSLSAPPTPHDRNHNPHVSLQAPPDGMNSLGLCALFLALRFCYENYSGNHSGHPSYGYAPGMSFYSCCCFVHFRIILTFVIFNPQRLLISTNSQMTF